jgi:hypothetical protein
MTEGWKNKGEGKDFVSIPHNQSQIYSKPDLRYIRSSIYWEILTDFAITISDQNRIKI